MKKIMVLVMLAAIVGVLNAGVLPDGDFETPANIEIGAWVGSASFQATGGNPGACGILTGQAIFVLGKGPANPGVGPALLPQGMSGGDTITVSMDMKALTPGAQPGIKIESWDADHSLGDSGHMLVDVTSNWATYTFTYTLNPNATHYKLVPLGDWDTGSTAFDNVGFVGFGDKGAHSPVPTNGAWVDTSLTTLSWTNPDPNNPGDTITAEAYLLESDVAWTKDPNLGPDVFEPGVTELTVNTDDYQSADVTGLISPDKYYYWAVHVIDSNSIGNPVMIAGPVWTFHTANDGLPFVDAGAEHLYLWLDGGNATVPLAGASDGDSVEWACTDQPLDSTVLIDNTASLATTADVDMTGDYTFTLTATNAYGSSSDAVEVHIYQTFCEAAYADPDDIAARYPNGQPSDINGDCKVDLNDFAILAGTWLDCMTEKAGCIQ